MKNVVLYLIANLTAIHLFAAETVMIAGKPIRIESISTQKKIASQMQPQRWANARIQTWLISIDFVTGDIGYNVLCDSNTRVPISNIEAPLDSVVSTCNFQFKGASLKASESLSVYIEGRMRDYYQNLQAYDAAGAQVGSNDANSNVFVRRSIHQVAVNSMLTLEYTTQRTTFLSMTVDFTDNDTK